MTDNTFQQLNEQAARLRNDPTGPPGVFHVTRVELAAIVQANGRYFGERDVLQMTFHGMRLKLVDDATKDAP